MSHNKPCLPPKLLNDFSCLFLLDITVIPREIEDNAYEFFWGGWGEKGGKAIKVYYGRFANGIF